VDTWTTFGNGYRPKRAYTQLRTGLDIGVCFSSDLPTLLDLEADLQWFPRLILVPGTRVDPSGKVLGLKHLGAPPLDLHQVRLRSTVPRTQQMRKSLF
jgi:hypothetical protein